MQLSLSSASPTASTESVDLLILPASDATATPTAGFGDLMAGLLPTADQPAETLGEGAAELAGAQATVDLLAWLARTPPPPPPTLPNGAVSGADLPTAEGDLMMDSDGSDPVATQPTLPFAGAVSAWGRWTTPATNPAVMAGAESAPLTLGTGSSGPVPSSQLSSAPQVQTAGVETDLLAALPADAESVVGAAQTVPGAPGDEAAAPAAASLLPTPMTFAATARLAPEARGEKIAAAGRGRISLGEATETPKEKNFLNIDSDIDAEVDAMVGTGVAKREFTMPVINQTSPASTARPDSGADAMVLETAGTPGDTASPSAPVKETPAAIAHTAVAAVTKAVERAEAAPRTAVNLQFSIGDTDLVVRIEHRADEVRATFRTDSSELRAALSSEWQSAVTGGADHALRRVEPVFTTAASSEDPRSTPDGQTPGFSQRQTGREAAGEPATPFAAFLRRPSASSAAGGISEPAVAARPALLPTALHLQTFA